jgi:hypothetical protein
MRRIRDVLTNNGLDLGDHILVSAVDISNDGLTITGYTTDYEGWIATIPEPSAALLLAVGTCVCLSGQIFARIRRRDANPEQRA